MKRAKEKSSRLGGGCDSRSKPSPVHRRDICKTSGRGKNREQHPPTARASSPSRTSTSKPLRIFHWFSSYSPLLVLDLCSDWIENMEIASRHVNGEPPRKRFKASELPLTQHQRTAIDNLVHTFKKKGQFDTLRKTAYSAFEDSAAKENYITSLTAFAESELDRNHALLGKDRRQAAPLIEGAAERKDVYKQTEHDVERMIDDALVGAEDTLREIRGKIVGKEAAAAELDKGSKSDAEYLRESAARKAVWERQREAEREKQRQKEAEEERRLEQEKQRHRAEEEEKERQRAIEAEQRRKEAEEKEKQKAEYRALKARQDAQWEKERLEKEAKERKIRDAEREKEMEAAALEELIRDSKRAAERSARDNARSSTSKGTAMEAIMRKEQKERERDELGSSSRRSSEADMRPPDSDIRRSFSTSIPSGPAAGQSIQRPTSNVWVAEGQRKPRLGYSSISIKPPAPMVPSTPTGPADSPYLERQREYHDPEPRHNSRRDYESEDPYHRRSRHDEHEHYDQDRSHRSSRRERSRSPDHHRSSRHSNSHYRERTRSPAPATRRRRSRSREHEGIDRYVPGGGSSKPRESESRQEPRESRHETREHREPREPRETRHEPRHRPSDADREKKKPVEIDSYIPSTSIRAKAKPNRRSRSPSAERKGRRDSRTERTRSHSRGSRR